MKYKIYEIISIATDMYDMDYNTIFDCIFVLSYIYIIMQCKNGC